MDSLLEALGVEDVDGFVENVVFSVGDETNWWHDWHGFPNEWGVDSDGSDDWTWELSPLDGTAPTWTVTAMEQADFNQDGLMDVVVAVDVPATVGNDFVSILWNDGRGTFTAESRVELHFPVYTPHPDPTDPTALPYMDVQLDPTDMVVGDFDNDDYPDIATANSNVDHR